MAGSDLGDDFEYRPLSTGAIASAVFGVLSSLVFVTASSSLSSSLWLAPIPVVGLVAGWLSLQKIRSMPDQLSGRAAALIGILLSALGLFGGLGFASYVHATEVPEGYTRTSFYEFRPDQVEERGGKLVPPDVLELDQKQVFIKGFMRPSTGISKAGTPVRNHVSQFLLVRDNNQCCFGDISDVKYYDQVLVQLTGSKTTNESGGMFRMGGKLRILPQNVHRKGHPVFILEADYVK
jgi:hypothetical protein